MKLVKILTLIVVFSFIETNIFAQDVSDTNNDGQITTETGLPVGLGVESVHQGLDLELPNGVGIRAGNDSQASFFGRNFSFNDSNNKFSKIDNKLASSIVFNNQGILFSLQDNDSPNTQTHTNFWNTIMKINKDGYILIGDVTAGDAPYKLFVEDGILTEKIKVASYPGDNWSDYVFEESYDLNKIEEVEIFVQENKHLPNVPSAKDVNDNGFDLAEMDATLLRQIEELWLHTIEINKEKEALKTENDLLKDKYTDLLNRIEALESQTK